MSILRERVRFEGRHGVIGGEDDLGCRARDDDDGAPVVPGIEKSADFLETPCEPDGMVGGFHSSEDGDLSFEMF